MAYGEVSKCGRKTALSIFFAVTFVAFTLSVISIISPSWQYVYLENGRTEHHHGLWLDCKRDYSFDYGRTREYYETLYRRDLQGSPFDIFFLPPLQCVYKFDYYIDPEDLYDHNHDENRIQNDAYQHLFLGWKIAALTGCGLAVVFSAASLLLAVCAFCHRTFICASTVLVTIAAILSTIGIAVFYAWANYQDNKVIKEDEDTIYEQILGWAFYCQVVTTVIHWLAAMLGCCVTSVSFSKTRAKLVKIEVVDGNDDMELLSGGHSSSQPFKRSFSAIYRVDSKSLRHWEHEYMKNARERQQAQAEATFKRTASVPNFSKKQENLSESRKRPYQKQRRSIFSSTSNITETTNAGSANTLEINQSRSTAMAPVPPPRHPISSPDLPALPKLKSALKTPQPSRKSVNIDDSDVTYEYLPCDGSTGVSSFIGERPSSSERTYDPVYERIGQDYLEPNSLRRRSVTALNVGQVKKSLLPTQQLPGSTQSIPIVQKKTTVINDVGRPLSSSEVPNAIVTQTNQNIPQHVLEQPLHKQTASLTDQSSAIDSRPPQSIRDFGIPLNPKHGYCDVKNTHDSKSSHITYADFETAVHNTKPRAPSPLRYIMVDKSSAEQHHEPAARASSSLGFGQTTSRINDSFDDSPTIHNGIAINTFGEREKQNSITNLTFRPQSTTGASEVFERPDSMTIDTSSSIVSSSSRKPQLLQKVLQRKLLTVVPDEVDRSVGSSTLFEADTLRDSEDSYVANAEIRLNLFMKDVPKDETTV